MPRHIWPIENRAAKKPEQPRDGGTRRIITEAGRERQRQTDEFSETPEEIETADREVARILAQHPGRGADARKNVEIRAIGADGNPFVLPMPEAFADGQRDELQRAAQFVVGGRAKRTLEEELTLDYFGAVFRDAGRGNAGRHASHPINKHLLETRLMGSSSGAAGEYLMPPGYIANLLKAPPDDTSLYQAASYFPVKERSGEMPTAASMPTITYGSEGVGIGDTGDPTLGQATWSLKRRQAKITVNRDYLEDTSPDAVGAILSLLREALDEERERSVAYGSGSGQPYGLYQSTGITDVSGITAVSFANLSTLYYSVSQRYQPRCTWTMNQNVFAAIGQLVDDVGQPLVANSIVTGFKPMILGKPVILKEHFPDTYIGYGWIGGYHVYDRQITSIDVSTEAGDAYDKYQAVIRLIERVDGKFVNPRSDQTSFARSKILTGITSLTPPAE